MGDVCEDQTAGRTSGLGGRKGDWAAVARADGQPARYECGFDSRHRPRLPIPGAHTTASLVPSLRRPRHGSGLCQALSIIDLAFFATRVSSPSEHVISSSYRTPLPGYIYTNTQERSGNQPGTIVRSLYNKTRSLLLHWSCGGGHDGQRRLQARWGERRRRVRRMTKAIDGNGKMLRDDGRLCAFDPQAISGGDGECAILQIGNSKANKKSSKSGRCSNHCQ